MIDNGSTLEAERFYMLVDGVKVGHLAPHSHFLAGKFLEEMRGRAFYVSQASLSNSRRSAWVKAPAMAQAICVGSWLLKPVPWPKDALKPVLQPPPKPKAIISHWCLRQKRTVIHEIESDDYDFLLLTARRMIIHRCMTDITIAMIRDGKLTRVLRYRTVGMYGPGYQEHFVSSALKDLKAERAWDLENETVETISCPS